MNSSSNKHSTRKSNRQLTKTKFYTGKQQSTTTTSSDGFISPNKPAKKAKLSGNSPPIITSNTYNELSDEYTDLDTENEMEKIQTQRKSRRKILKQNSPRKVQNEIARKMKPIVIQNISNEEVQQIIKDCKLPATYAKKYENFHINTTSIEDKTSVVEKLKTKNHRFHTYSEPSQRHATFVLRNHYRCDREMLLKTLNDANIPATRVDFLVDSNNPLYLVQFATGKISLDSLNRQHKVINRLVVTWEFFTNRSKKPTQCKNCQSWGHAASNCGHKSRCVKCLDDHARGECSRKDKSVGEPSCVNCGLSGHPSNSPSCAAYIKHVKFLQSRMKSHQPRSLPATEAPWAQPNTAHQQRYPPWSITSEYFPSLPRPEPPGLNSNHNHNYVKENHVHSQDCLRSNQNSKNKTLTFQGAVNEIRAEANDIPFLDEAICIALKVINKMKEAKTPEEAAATLLNFVLLKKCD